MTRFILMRHGQTQWNREERFRSRADLALDATGKKQAEAAAIRLKEARAVAIYCSPLRRALQTAKIVGEKLNLPVQTLEGLIDLDFGSFEGLSEAEATQQYPELYRLWLQRPHEVRFPGGEALEDIRQRVVPAVEQLAAQYKDQTVILVSHKVVCQLLMCIMFGLDNSHFWQVRQDVNAINIFELRNGAPLIISVNDTCHLRNLAVG